MKRWAIALLIFELALFATILILPQVELPEFAFRAGASPVLAKASVTSAPVLIAPGAIMSLAALVPWDPTFHDVEEQLTSAFADTRLSRLCTFLC